jgi:hypothetical protein
MHQAIHEESMEAKREFQSKRHCSVETTFSNQTLPRGRSRSNEGDQTLGLNRQNSIAIHGQMLQQNVLLSASPALQSTLANDAPSAGVEELVSQDGKFMI